VTKSPVRHKFIYRVLLTKFIVRCSSIFENDAVKQPFFYCHECPLRVPPTSARTMLVGIRASCAHSIACDAPGPPPSQHRCLSVRCCPQSASLFVADIAHEKRTPVPPVAGDTAACTAYSLTIDSACVVYVHG
jgi:hypothetical protein